RARGARAAGREGDAHAAVGGRAPAPERAAAGRAEALGPPGVRGCPLAHELVSLDNPQRPASDARLRRGSRPGPPPAARAVAVGRRDERRGHLVADAAAEAASGEGEMAHAGEPIGALRSTSIWIRRPYSTETLPCSTRAVHTRPNAWIPLRVRPSAHDGRPVTDEVSRRVGRSGSRPSRTDTSSTGVPAAHA